MSESDGLIVIPEGFGGGAPKRKPTKIRLVESDRIVSDARQALRVPKEEGLYMTLLMGVIETPLGYIVVDEEGGHHKIPFLSEESITLLVWSRRTGQPYTDCPVTIGQLLRYTNKTMPVADFVSNRDGMEERWESLLVTLMSAGIRDVSADRARRERNNTAGYITGGAGVFDKTKNAMVETTDED
jgi:hypothetical protein